MKLPGIVSQFIFVKFRLWKYRQLSTCYNVTGKPLVYHPLLLVGKGSIAFGTTVQIGVISSPNFYSHYSYFEARDTDSFIKVGDNTAINNGFSAVALKSITIGNNVLIGINCSIMDSDGHHLEVNKRNDGNPPAFPVHIGNNVFIGDDVTILKGVAIGDNAVIGSNSTVTKNVPRNSIYAGNPARMIKEL